MESVKREHVQMLGFVSMVIRNIEKCATNIEGPMQGWLGSVDKTFNKDLEELLSYIHIQLAIISSTEKAIETIT